MPPWPPRVTPVRAAVACRQRGTEGATAERIDSRTLPPPFSVYTSPIGPLRHLLHRTITLPCARRSSTVVRTRRTVRVIGRATSPGDANNPYPFHHPLAHKRDTRVLARPAGLRHHVQGHAVVDDYLSLGALPGQAWSQELVHASGKRHNPAPSGEVE